MMKPLGMILSLATLLLIPACPGSETDDTPDGSTVVPAACAELGEAGCLDRADCVVDTCLLCSCTPSFNACRSTDDPVTDCPVLGCAQPLCCSDASDCTGAGQSCLTPGESMGCGICFDDPGDCQSDADCGALEVCEPIACSCAGTSACVPGCVSEEDCASLGNCNSVVLCDPGEVCESTAHPRCIAASCSQSLDCPADFDCVTGACARRTCTDDSDCDAVCVNGECHASYGSCEAPRP